MEWLKVILLVHYLRITKSKDYVIIPCRIRPFIYIGMWMLLQLVQSCIINTIPTLENKIHHGNDTERSNSFSQSLLYIYLCNQLI